MKKIIKTLFSFSMVLLLTSPTFAYTYKDELDDLNYILTPFPKTPRVSLSGFAGTGTTAKGDAMVALSGSAKHALYTNFQGRYARQHNTWMGSLGLKHRTFLPTSPKALRNKA